MIGVAAEKLNKQFLVISVTLTYKNEFKLGDFDELMAIQIRVFINGINSIS